jgi:hypothetical protein
MKIKDLPQDINLIGIRFIYPSDGKPYYWFSQWQRGVWGKKKMDTGEVFPLLVNNPEEALEWEVSE